MSSPHERERFQSASLQNFCVSFIDLLGQRDALRGQDLLPEFRGEAGKRNL